MKHEGYNPYAAAQTQFDHVADIIDLDPSVRQLLRQPSREVQFTIPVKMDDAKTQVFMVSEFSTTQRADRQRAESVFIRRKQRILSERYPCG